MDTQDLEIKSIANNWSSWMTGQTNFKRLNNNKIQVITPFIDNFGDGILFNIISKENDIYQVTDEGYTIWNLTSNGINVKSKQSNRWRILLSIITPYNFKIGMNDTIFKLVKKSELSQTITDFIQVLINVSDIAFMNRTNTASVFFDDVRDYFNERRSDYSFLNTIYADGKTSQKYKFEYLFTPKPNEFKLTKMYNTLSKNSMEAIIGIWSDTSGFRENNYGTNSSFNILINGISDKEKPFIDGLLSHEIDVIDFQNKNEVKDKLSIK
ncbi:DUF1828 domain-containing protein [Latilactobacillus sakei]|uniref:DUF1828 domain-containing protein n=1 Tax=Latilactobacillus sakei TaxID=1599 RepID=UPI003CEEB530